MKWWSGEPRSVLESPTVLSTPILRSRFDSEIHLGRQCPDYFCHDLISFRVRPLVLTYRVRRVLVLRGGTGQPPSPFPYTGGNSSTTTTRNCRIRIRISLFHFVLESHLLTRPDNPRSRTEVGISSIRLGFGETGTRSRKEDGVRTSCSVWAGSCGECKGTTFLSLSLHFLSMEGGSSLRSTRTVSSLTRYS